MSKDHKENLATNFLINEYNAVLEDVRVYSRTCWRIFLAFIAGSGAGVAALPYIEHASGIILLGITYFLLGLFLTLTIYKNRRFIFVDFARLGEIEETTKNALRTNPNTPWGRWGKVPFDRLWDSVKRTRGYKRKLTGFVDFAMMFLLTIIGILWILAAVWIVTAPEWGSSSDLLVILSGAFLISLAIALKVLCHLWHSETEKQKRFSTSLAKQVEALVREAVHQTSVDPALNLYRRNLKGHVEDFERELQEL